MTWMFVHYPGSNQVVNSSASVIRRAKIIVWCAPHLSWWSLCGKSWILNTKQWFWYDEDHMYKLLVRACTVFHYQRYMQYMHFLYTGTCRWTDWPKHSGVQVMLLTLTWLVKPRQPFLSVFGNGWQSRWLKTLSLIKVFWVCWVKPNLVQFTSIIKCKVDVKILQGDSLITTDRVWVSPLLNLYL